MLALLIASLLAQAPASTGSVYLKCVTVQHGSQKNWDITLNESAGTVDYDSALSGPQRTAARFTADAVYFIGFTLSRENLTIARPLDGEVESGTCKIATAKNRAF